MKKQIKRRKVKLNLKEERGAEILQVVLISGVLLVLIITLFYPQMESLFNEVMGTMTDWFQETGSKPFTV